MQQKTNLIALIATSFILLACTILSSPQTQTSSARIAPSPEIKGQSEMTPTPSVTTQGETDNVDWTWGLPIGAAYELRGVCEDITQVAQMSADGQIDEETTSLGLLMLGDQLSIVKSGLSEWQASQSQSHLADDLNDLTAAFDQALNGWLDHGIPAADALAMFEMQCPRVYTVLDDLNNLASSEGVSDEYLSGLSDTYDSMPSVIDFLK